MNDLDWLLRFTVPAPVELRDSEGGLVKFAELPYDNRPYIPYLVLHKRAQDSGAPFTIAVHLDTVLLEPEYPFSRRLPESPKQDALVWLQELYRSGARVILFTLRDDTEELRRWLHEHDVPYDAINRNLDGSGDEIIADAYWDERGLRFSDFVDLAHKKEQEESEQDNEPPVRVTITIRETVLTSGPEIIEGLCGCDTDSLCNFTGD